MALTDTTDPYPSAQALFDRGGSENKEDTFNDVFKKDLIEIAGMKGHRLMRRMRIDPYPVMGLATWWDWNGAGRRPGEGMGWTWNLLGRLCCGRKAHKSQIATDSDE